LIERANSHFAIAPGVGSPLKGDIGFPVPIRWKSDMIPLGTPGCPIGEYGVIRISIAYFYALGGTLRPLASLKGGGSVSDSFVLLYTAQQSLEGFFNTYWFGPAIKSSYSPGQTLLGAIREITSKADFSETITDFEAYGITKALNDFETVINAELSVADAYFVSRKAGYDTYTLISSAEAVFPADLPIKVPNAIPDIREAGKCLAYEVGTAAGFHALRAMEAVLRKYWEIVTEGKPHPGQRNIGVYIQKMEKLGVGEPKVIAALKQIKDLHRNPLMHPEETLTLDDAIGIFGIVHSAMGSMLREIPVTNPIAKGFAEVLPSP
jgi:hypothetical protein